MDHAGHIDQAHPRIIVVAALGRAAGTLDVDCGSVEASALRALRAAIWAGVAWFGAAGMSSQKPRALMISAGVSGLAAAWSVVERSAQLKVPGVYDVRCPMASTLPAAV